MRIRAITGADIPQWMALSREYDPYVEELAPDLAQWYEGFEGYMQAKIDQGEAFMAADAQEGCSGAIAFSRKNNRITFFAVAHRADFQKVGKALLDHALACLDETKPVYINEIDSQATWVRQHSQMYLRCGFIFLGHALENGVSVNTFEKPPSAGAIPADSFPI